MQSYLKSYTLTLTTLSPLFIGSGDTINKKEYIFDQSSACAYVPNMEKMFAYFIQRHLLQDYENFLLNDRRDFVYWLREKGISKDVYSKWCDYALDSGDAVFEDRSKKEFKTFVKDVYHLPYVPGSSLKGALRTCLLSYAIVQNSGKFSYNANDVSRAELKGRKCLGREVKQLEKRALSKKLTPENDIDLLAGVRVSDSKPLATSDLVLCQKVDLCLDGKENKLMLMECVKPNTQITFDITIDTTICPFSAKGILEAIHTFSKQYYQNFSGKFPFESIDDNVLYLGGNVGYASKTVTYPLLGKQGVKRVSQIIDATLGYNQRKLHKHFKDATLGVSPHTLKITKYQHKSYEMGTCKVAITPVK